MTVVNISDVDKRPECAVSILGANRGGMASQNHVVRTAQQSTAYRFQVAYTDAVAGRAEALATRARTQGLAAVGHEADIRELPAGSLGKIIISHLDDPRLLAEILANNPDADILGYVFARTADDRLALVCTTAAADETEERFGSALLLMALDRHSAAGGSEFIFGDQSTAAIRQIEPLFRTLVGFNITDKIDRLLSRRSIEPGTHICLDGREALRTVVLDHREPGWANPAVIAHEQLSNPKHPIARGKSMVAAEIGPDAEIRLHVLRRRVTDEAVTVGGVAVIDPRTVSMRTPEAWQQAQRERQAALAVAAANTITRRRRPVYVTD
ncbi:MAG: hypothetical protein WB973_17105 [Thermoanaerobaculia bacterium]